MLDTPAGWIAPSWLLAVLLLFIPCLSLAQYQPALEQQRSPVYLARIELHTAEELMVSLQHAEALQKQGEFKVGSDLPIVFVLHGAEARALFIDRYSDNKPLVDLAARLSALRVVDIKVCETWMGSRALDASQLQPFVGVVPFGPAEEQRLLKEKGYVYF